MYHTIEFTRQVEFDLETSCTQRLQRLRIPRGTRMLAQVKPYVVETEKGPVEVADLFFEAGSARGIPFALFSFAE